MSDFNIPHLTEQLLACRSLVITAKSTSESVDKFVQWMLTGFAAGLTYLLGQHSPLDKIKLPILMFLAAFGVAIIQKYLAMIVTTGTKAFLEAEKNKNENTNFDIARFFIIYIDSLPVSVGWAAAWSASRFMQGNLTASGRGLLRLAIWQSWLAFICIGLLLYCLYLTAKSVTL